MPDYRYSPILSMDACNGPVLFLRADSLGDDYPFTIMTDEQNDTTLCYDWFVVHSLAGRIGIVDPEMERFVKNRPLIQSALSVLRNRSQGLEAYRSHYHDRCDAALRKMQLQSKSMQPPLIVCLRTANAAADLATVLEDIKMAIAARLAWRADVIRREDMFLHWQFTACTILSRLPKCSWMVPDGVVYLMVKEARAIVTENLIVGGRLPSAVQLLKNSIWNRYYGKDMMLAAIGAALSEWVIETSEYQYIQKVTPR
ncbi:hypothetical protein KBV55_003178 [Salmonella enterica]|nr:hypothetical protein [Salmonella enterica]EAW2232646.1 hypothetical protein [Salmonella enterica subsp. enterica]EEP3165490.1 hypothetical protein [Salmonella enterica subsp. houtenae serovar 43:z4,z32:-]EBH3347455.1 hypothetical protein [Salmonella enterica]EBH6588332.1 hypothetical protein [Salmonella enterica]